MLFIRLIIFIIAAIILGVLYNKYVINRFSGFTAKVLCFLTILIFISTSITLSVGVSMNLLTTNFVKNSSTRVVQLIHNTFPDSELVANGICLNHINDNISQVYTFATELRVENQINYLIDIGLNSLSQLFNSSSWLQSIIIHRIEDRIRERTYATIMNTRLEESISQVESAYRQFEENVRLVKFYTMIINRFTDSYNVLTISSIIGYFTFLVTREVNIWFFGLYILLLIPLLIFVVLTSVFAFIAARKVKQKQKINPPPPIPTGMD